MLTPGKETGWLRRSQSRRISRLLFHEATPCSRECASSKAESPASRLKAHPMRSDVPRGSKIKYEGITSNKMQSAEAQAGSIRSKKKKAARGRVAAVFCTRRKRKFAPTEKQAFNRKKPASASDAPRAKYMVILPPASGFAPAVCGASHAPGAPIHRAACGLSRSQLPRSRRAAARSHWSCAPAANQSGR